MSQSLSRVERWYPRSFLQLLLVAFALAALPVVFAYLYAALQLDRLSVLSRTAVFQAAGAARESRRLVDEATTLERVARQYLVLGDAALFDDYGRLRQRFKRTTSALALLPLDDQQLGLLNDAVELEEALHERLRAPLPGAIVTRTRMVTDYAELSDLTARLLAGSNAVIDREIAHLRDLAAHAGRSLWWQFLGLVPVAVALAFGLAWMVGRPVRQLDTAIRRIGAGDLDESVVVNGPRDLNQLGERLDWLRRRLAELETQRERLLRHVSHELKTPLTSIREGAELLSDGTGGSLTPMQRDIAAILRSKSVELQGLIEKLIEYHRARSDPEPLVRTDVRLDEMAKQVIEDHRLALAARGMRIEPRLDTVVVLADAGKLRVIVDNLLSNAVRYSPDGGLVILEVRREGANVLVEVIDEGPGVPAAERERIFDWFERGEAARGGVGDPRVRGSGLGLAIAREWVLAHDGVIEVINSARGSGAHFRVRLPVPDRGR